MNIGDSVTFVENDENQNGTISWIAPEYVFVKKQSGEVVKLGYDDIKLN